MTPRSSSPTANRNFRLRGGNAEAWNYRPKAGGELVVYGGAGTGKTVGNLLRLLNYGDTYPGARMLIIRKTRVSLTESALATWENLILGQGHPVLGNAIQRTSRHQYVWPNSSVLVTGGMDKPDKVLSTEWDAIYCPECNELNVAEWETLGGRIRAMAGPYDLLFGDCNPTVPSHWICRRAKAKQLKLVSTQLRDNPQYYDTAKREWTELGKRYLARLYRMSGARIKRFLKGQWAAAEGLVFDNFNERIHLLPAGWTTPHSWRRVWGLDFGHSNPMALTCWAVDGDGRMYLYREWYHTGMRVEVLAKRVAADMHQRGEPPPEAILADHDPEGVATFTAHSGLQVRMADKSERDLGLEGMIARFDRAGDRRPRIYLARDTLAHRPDPQLLEKGKPTCLLDELGVYSWDLRNPDRLKDEPLKENDHASDSGRYVSRYVGKGTNGNRGPVYGYSRNSSLDAW